MLHLGMDLNMFMSKKIVKHKLKNEDFKMVQFDVPYLPFAVRSFELRRARKQEVL